MEQSERMNLERIQQLHVPCLTLKYFEKSKSERKSDVTPWKQLPQDFASLSLGSSSPLSCKRKAACVK